MFVFPQAISIRDSPQSAEIETEVLASKNEASLGANLGLKLSILGIQTEILATF